MGQRACVLSQDDFAAAYEKGQRQMYLVALSMLKNPHAAEDALQNAYVKAYQKLGQLKDVSRFSAWATRILINECYNHLRKNKGVFVCADEALEAELGVFEDEEKKFFELVCDLPLKDKEVVTLRYFHQMSLEEIAQCLKLPLSTVKSRLYRALEKLKTEWGE